MDLNFCFTDVPRFGEARPGWTWQGCINTEEIMATAEVVAVDQVSNGAKGLVEQQSPYMVRARITGATDLLLHAWNCESIEDKGRAKKGSAAKRTDDLESYVRRNEDGVVCVPSEYIRMAIVGAAKFRQDPRSPRKSAQDLYKAAVIPLDALCPIRNCAGEPPKVWDYVDKRRVQVQRNGITRLRPAFQSGWQIEAVFLCNLPEYISPGDIHDVLVQAGMVIGIGDFRPTYGRFRVSSFELTAE
jgi:hypothetical protein